MNERGLQAPPSDLTREQAFGRIYDLTIDAAFSLAYRITANREAASAACEAAYAAAFADCDPAAWTQRDELDFLARVRTEALARKPSAQSASSAASYARESAVRDLLAAADPVGRRAIELCYFGGMTAAEAAEVLGADPAAIRSAMRRVLLAIAGSARKEGVQ